jgi:hypothetical protein
MGKSAAKRAASALNGCWPKRTGERFHSRLIDFLCSTASIESLAWRDHAGRGQDVPLDGSLLRKSVPAARSNANKLLIEPLEPRLLLSADVLGLDLSSGPESQQNHSLLVRQIEETRIVGEQAVSVQQVQIVDGNSGLVLAFGDRAQIASIVIKTGSGNDSLTVDLGSFGDGLPPPPISFDGGEGSDQLIVETTVGTPPILWTIDGHNSGLVTGPLNVEFSHVENLAGANDVDDTFIVTASGRLDGLLDGGARGFDSLEIEGTYSAVTATLDGERTILDLDGTLLTYKGIEPVRAGGGQLQLAILGTDGNDEVVLEEGPAPGLFQIRSANHSFATQIITPSIQTVVLGLSTGADSFTSTLSAANPFVGNIIIAETANLTLGNISGIDGDFSVSTISTVNKAEPGKLDWDGSGITIADHAVISITGDLTLTVNAYDVLDASTIQEWISAPIIKGTITVGEGAVINARNVALEVIASNERQIFLSIDAASLVNMALEDAQVAAASHWTEITLLNNSDGTATFLRTNGSWSADGFEAGQQLLLHSDQKGINQSFRVISVDGQNITVELPANVALPAVNLLESEGSITAYYFTRVAGDDLIAFAITEDGEDGIRSVIARQVPVENPDASFSGTVNFVETDGVFTITRNGGSWVAEGFLAGQTIVVEGAGANSGTYTVTSATATVLTLSPDDTLAEKSGVSGVSIRGHALGSFTDEGFAEGDLIVVQNSAHNDKTYTIAEVRDHILVLAERDVIYGETIDLSAANAPQLIIQKVNADYFFIRVSGDDEINFAIMDDGENGVRSVIARQVPSENPDASFSGTVSFVETDGVFTITRNSGSWVAEGFLAGQTIVVEGAGENSGTYTVTLATATVLTLSPDDTLAVKSDVSGVSIRGHALGSFIDEGFAAGDLIVVKNSLHNDKTYTIAEVRDRILVLAEGEVVDDETIDLSAANAPQLIIQKDKTGNLPLLLLDSRGQTIKGSDGNPLSFTQQELEDAFAAQDTAIADGALTYLLDNPVTDFLAGFGLRVIGSDLSAAITIKDGAHITASGDVTIFTQANSEVDGSIPSVVTGVSVVYSKVASTIDVQRGVTIEAGGDVSIEALTEHNMSAGATVTSGSIVNPLQGALKNFVTDTYDSTLGEVDPTGGAVFSTLMDFVPNVTGFVRVPGPAIAVAVGIADTDAKVTVGAGSSIVGHNVAVNAENESEYGVEASSIIFQPGANQGFGIAAAISVTHSDAVVNIAGNIRTHEDAGGGISVTANSVNEANSVSSTAWVRDIKEGMGGVFELPGNFDRKFLEKINNKQNELRAKQEIGSHFNENPGALAVGAGISVLVSTNRADVTVSGALKADSELFVASYAEENPSATAAGATEGGATTAISGGVIFARYDNTALTTIAADAELLAGGAADIWSTATIPNPFGFGDLFGGNFDEINNDYQDALAEAAMIEDAEARAEAERIALATYNEKMSEAALKAGMFFYESLKNIKWGLLGGSEEHLLTSWVNSGTGGDYKSNNPADRVLVVNDKGEAVLDDNGEYKTELANHAKQETDFSVSGNINILEFHNRSEVVIGERASIHAGDSLTISSVGSVESVNLTGLTSVWDIVWSAVSRFTGGDDGASTSGAEAGIGANVGIRIFSNTSKTTINANADLVSSDGDVAITSKTHDLHVNMHEIAADGGSVGVSGSVSIDVMNTVSEALVDESVSIVAGGGVKLKADSDLVQANVTVAGAEAKGGSVAVGAAVGVNVISSTTRAEIADLDKSIGSNADAIDDAGGAAIQAGGDVFVRADRNEVVAQIAMAGSARTPEKEGPPPAPPEDPDAIYDGIAQLFAEDDPDAIYDGIAQLFAEDDDTTQPSDDQQDEAIRPTNDQQKDTIKASQNSNAVAVAGAVLVDVNTATVTASIGPGASINAGGTVKVRANANRDAVFVDGAGVIDTTGDGGAAALAGGFAIGVGTRVVDAVVSGAVIHGGALDVYAERGDLLVVVSLGGAGAARTDVAVAGSVNVAVFDNAVCAKVLDSYVDADGNVTIDARSSALLVSVAGAAGVVVDGDAGVGAALSVSFNQAKVHAYLDGSMVFAGGDVIVHAHSELVVVSLAASAGVSISGSGASGQISLHLATNDVDARIGDGSVVDAENNALVLADDAIVMITVTGGIEFGTEAAGGVGLSSTNIYDRIVKAHIDDGASVAAGASGELTSIEGSAGGAVSADGIMVKAAADDVIINVVVGMSGAVESFAGRGSILVDTNHTAVSAYVGSDDGTADKYAKAHALNGGDISVLASYDVTAVNVVGGIAISGGGFAAGASANVSIHHRTVNADVGRHAVVDADGSVTVEATLDGVLRTVLVTGALSATNVAFAGAITVPVVNDFVTAQVMDGAAVDAGDDVAIASRHSFEFTLVDAVASVSGSSGIGASVGVVVQNATIKALVGDADIVARDTVMVEAIGTAALQNLVGGVAIGGKSSVGGSGFVLVRNDSVIAEIGSAATVTALALGSGFVRTKVSRDDGDPNTLPETETVSGVGVYAQSWEEIVGIAIQGGVSGSLTFAGSAPVTVIKETTTATIGKGALINISDEVAGEDQDVIVRAKDDTLIVNVAGNVAISGSGSLGGTSDVASLTKTTSAVIETNTPADLAADAGAASVFANRDIRVEAEGNDNLVSVAAGISGAATAALGINASVYVLDIDTTAVIGAGATLVAEGSVIVDAAHRTETDHIFGTVTVSGVAAANGGAVVVVIDKTVHAVIEEDASVTGKALRDGLSDIRTGRIVENVREVTENPVNGDSDAENGFEFVLPNDQPDGSVNYLAPQIRDDEGSTDGMFVARDFRAEFISDTGAGASFRGVSVTATNVDDLMTIAGAVSGSGAASISGTAAVSVVNSNVEASVRNGAEINTDNGSHGSEQSVQIAAGNAFDHLGVVVAAGGSGGVTVLPAAHILVGDLTTKAAVEEASVNAKRNIAVRADAHEDVQSVGFLIAGSGTGSIAPTLSTAVLTSKTSASITGDAKVNSSGNVLIGASDDTNVDVVEVALAGAGGFALGAAISVVDVQKTTEATIGAGAAVDARASAGGAMPALTGEQVCLDNESMRGILVDARSFEDIDVVTFGLGAGPAGFAGSLGRQTVDADTIAGIHGGARINAQNASLADDDQSVEDQSVYVSAYNGLDLRGIAAGGAFGVVAGAAGVNVADLRNDTTAFIAGEVNARNRVSITALSDQDVEGIVFAGAAGGGSLSGAVGVFGIGGNIDSNRNLGFSYADGDGQQQSGTGLDGDQRDDVDGSHRTPDDIKGQLWSDSGEEPVKPAADTFASAKSSFADLDLNRLGTPTEQLLQTSEQPFERGTTAFVGRNASINAGEDIDIDARQNSNVTVIAGGTAVGALGATGGIGIVNIGNNVSAFLAGNATVKAGRFVSISADLTQHVQVTSFAGSAALTLALSAGVTSINDTSNVSAYIGDNAVFLAAEDIVVEANSDITLLGKAIGLSASLGISGAAAVVFISTEGATEAYAGENVRIGETRPDGQGEVLHTVGSLSISATSKVTIDSPEHSQGKSGVMAIGGSLGGAAVAAGDAHVAMSRTTAAHVGAGSDIRVNESIQILADSTSLVTAKAVGGAGGLFALGLMSSRAFLSSATSAEIRGTDNRRTSILGGALHIDSSEKAVVTVEAVSGSVALAGGRGAFANAILTASSHAGIGKNVDVLTSGDVNIRAHSAVEGDSTARANGGGAVDVGYSEAKTFINPVDPQNPEVTGEAPVMNKAFVSSGTIIISGGNVNIRSVASANEEPYSPIIAEIDPSNDTIKLNNEHGLSTGDLIQYKGTQGGTIGLVQDRDYRVIRLDADFIQLGESFRGSLSGNEVRVGLDPEFDVIRFGSAHSFKDGDRVRYVAPEPYVINTSAIVNDHITIPQHGLQTGDAVRWGREPDAETFYVIVVDANTIVFASTQNDAELGKAIAIPVIDGQDSYELIPQLPTGLVDGTIYTVNVIDEFSLKLISDSMTVRPSHNFSGNSVSNGTFSINNHGFNNGDAVTYDGPDVLPVTVDYVGVNYGPFDHDSDAATPNVPGYFNDDTGLILMPGIADGEMVLYRAGQSAEISLSSNSVNEFVTIFDEGSPKTVSTITIPDHGFSTGQKVIYHQGENVIAGLTDNTEYYVIKVNDNEIRLADSLLSAVGLFPESIFLSAVGDDEYQFKLSYAKSIPGLTDGETYRVQKLDHDLVQLWWVSIPIRVSHEGMQPGEIHNFYRSGQFPLPGLVDGKTYYVVNATDNTFQLSDTPGGPALNVNGAGISSTQYLSIAGIDMNRGWGSATLVIDLENDGTGELRSEGGGDLREIVKTPGNGISEAVAEGFGFALGSITANESTVHVNANVLVSINDAQITTINAAKGGNINILADNHLEGKASAKTFSVGLFTSNKLSVAIAEIHDQTRIDISGGARFSASGDILVKTESAQVFNARSETEGGGAEERARSNASAFITVDNSINILDGSDLLAAGELTVLGYTRGTADFLSKVKNGGLGALAYANRTVNLAPYINQIWGAHHTSNTRIAIGDSSNLAGSKTRIEAEASNITSNGKSDVHTGGLGTDADADSRATLTADGLIEIGALANITGQQGVVIRATNRGNKATSMATATSISLTGGTDTNARAKADLDAAIKAADAAAIYAGTGPSDVVALLVEVVEELNTVTATAPSTKGLLDTGTKIETPDKAVANTIVWDADVHLQGGAPYRLVIDEKGEIEIAENVSASTETGEIYVDDILVNRSRVGQVHFIASGSTGTESVTGQDGTFYLLNNRNSVVIENRSALDLVVQNIARDPAGPELSEEWNDVVIDSKFNGLTFSLSGYDSLDVNIHNLTESDVYIKGTIDNPFGDTTIRNDGGSILSWNARGAADEDGRHALIVTNRLDMDAPLGSIGTAGRSVNVDLVGYDGKRSGINADAGGDIRIDLKARNRSFTFDKSDENVGSEDIEQFVEHVQAGGSSSITLQTGEQELVLLVPGAVRVLSHNSEHINDELFDDLSGLYEGHYREGRIESPENTDSQDGGEDAPENPELKHGAIKAVQKVDSFYVLQDPEDVNVPAVIAGDNIAINAAAIGAASDPWISLGGLIDLGADGILSVRTSGWVYLVETDGNMNVGRVESTYANVILTANTGSILGTEEKSQKDEESCEDKELIADVIGTGVALFAEQGMIGATGETDPRYRSLYIDSRASRSGSVVVRALGDVFLIETGGDIDVKEIHSEGGDVRLATVRGSINDASSFATGTVQGRNIDLIAGGGSIGVAGGDFRIDTSDTGRLFAEASSGIFISEVAGSLHVLRAEATNGSVRLRTPDTIATSGENFILLSSGSNLLGEEFDHGLIAGTQVALEIGDNITTQDNSEIRAEEGIVVRGDHGNADTGTGTVMDLRGRFIAPLITFYGNADDDRFTFNQTYIGGETFAYGSNAASMGYDPGNAPQGDAGSDQFVVNHLQTMPGGPGDTAPLETARPTLNLDGQNGSDTYLIRTNGSASVESDYVINVIDAGAADNEINTLIVTGSDEDDDIFLLRRTIGVNEVNKAHGMVALLHGTLADSITNGSARPKTVERINYSSNITGGLTVAGLGGDDAFVSDDNMAITTLDGGEGDDLFQIGQLFGTPRLNPDGSGSLFEGITSDDQFVTQLTTNGWLSLGASFEMHAVGGAGDDCFSVFSHSAPLHIDAGEGDDSVAISTFRLVDPSVETTLAGSTRDEIAATLAQEHAKSRPDNVNAALTVDGGYGVDRVTVVRSHLGTTFEVADAHEIVGAGLSVSIANTESTLLSSRCADQCGLDLALVLPGETNPPPFDYCRGPIEDTIIPEPTVSWTLPHSLPAFANSWQPGDLRVSIAPLSSFPPPDASTLSSRREVVPGAGPDDDATEPPSEDPTELQSNEANPNGGADGDNPYAEQGNGDMPGVGDGRSPGAGAAAGGCCDCEEDDGECLQQCEDYKERCCSDGEGQHCKEDCPCRAPCQNGEQTGVPEPSVDRSSLKSESVLAALVLPAALTGANMIQLLSPRTAKTGREQQTDDLDEASGGRVWIEELGGFVRLDELERYGVSLRPGQSWFNADSENATRGNEKLRRPEIVRKSVINWSRL